MYSETVETRRYQSYQHVKTYLDIEADVDSSEEEDSDTEAQDDTDFLDDTETQRPDNITEHLETAISSLNDRLREHNARLAEARAIKTRYQAGHGRDDQQTEDTTTDENTDGTWEETICLLPSITDPDLWSVAVKRGTEVETVCLVMNRAFERDIKILSVFQRHHIPGIIYIEGPYTACVTALEGLSTVYLRYAQANALIRIVGIDDRVNLLYAAPTVVIKTSSFVRIRTRGKSRELVFVNKTSSRSAEIFRVFRDKDNAMNPTLVYEGTDQIEEESPMNLAPATVPGRFIYGLEIKRIPLYRLQASSVNPTIAELNDFSSSPLFRLPLSLETNNQFNGNSLTTTDHLAIAKRFTNAIIYHRKHAISFQIGEPVLIVAGIFSGLRGTIEETTDQSILLRLDPDTTIENYEVPVEHLDADAVIAPGHLVTVTTGPLKGIKGALMYFSDENHVVMEPVTENALVIEVFVWQVTRHFKPGDYIDILVGDNQGTSGYVISTNVWEVDIFIVDQRRVATLKTDCIVRSTVPNTLTTTPSEHSKESTFRTSQERFKGIEVLVVGTHHWKGRTGYIVGHAYTDAPLTSRQHHAEPGLVFHVNIGNSISRYPSTFGVNEIRELHTGLAILTAARLPLTILHPPNRPPHLPRPTTPNRPIISLPSRLSTIWDPIDNMERGHWLLNVRVNHKVMVVISNTVAIESNGIIQRPAFHNGKYEGMKGSVVIARRIEDAESSVNVRVNDETNRPFQLQYLEPLQEPHLFKVPARVVIIGPDLNGNRTHIGQYGNISACVYPLGASHRLLYIHHDHWAYFDIKELCYSGETIEWERGLY